MKKILTMLALAAWGASPLAEMPVMELTAGFHRIEAEVAADAQNRQVGLMNRKAMPPQRGMLFVFTEKNTLSEDNWPAWTMTAARWKNNTLIQPSKKSRPCFEILPSKNGMPSWLNTTKVGQQSKNNTDYGLLHSPVEWNFSEGSASFLKKSQHRP